MRVQVIDRRLLHVAVSGWMTRCHCAERLFRVQGGNSRDVYSGHDLAKYVSQSVFCLVFFLNWCFEAASHIAHCETLFRLGEISAIVGTTATSFLFLLSVRAVFENSKAVTAFFGSFWLIGMGTSILRQFASRDAVSPPPACWKIWALNRVTSLEGIRDYTAVRGERGQAMVSGLSVGQSCI